MNPYRAVEAFEAITRHASLPLATAAVLLPVVIHTIIHSGLLSSASGTSCATYMLASASALLQPAAADQHVVMFHEWLQVCAAFLSNLPVKLTSADDSAIFQALHARAVVRALLSSPASSAGLQLAIRLQHVS